MSDALVYCTEREKTGLSVGNQRPSQACYGTQTQPLTIACRVKSQFSQQFANGSKHRYLFCAAISVYRLLIHNAEYYGI